MPRLYAVISIFLILIAVVAVIFYIFQIINLRTGDSPVALEEWKPRIGDVWQIQFTGLPIDLSAPADIFVLDLFDTPRTIINEIHARGNRAVCYINMGAWEDWRPDKNNFPREMIGKDYEGWPGERWLDISKVDLLAPTVRDRLKKCREKGFDGVEPDNLDGYMNDTGFPLTAEDQFKFNKFVADMAHNLGLSVGLKNDLEQAERLVEYFDWATVESCAVGGWCKEMISFTYKDKPVLQIEYTDSGVDFKSVCDKNTGGGFSPILKNRNLDSWIQYCR